MATTQRLTHGAVAAAAREVDEEDVDHHDSRLLDFVSICERSLGQPSSTSNLAFGHSVTLAQLDQLVVALNRDSPIHFISCYSIREHTKLGRGASGSVRIAELKHITSASSSCVPSADETVEASEAFPPAIAMKQMALTNSVNSMECISRELSAISSLAAHTKRKAGTALAAPTTNGPGCLVQLPNVIQIFSTQLDAEVTIAMELMAGSLSSRDAASRPFPAHRHDTLHLIARSVLNGLGELHDCRLVHNDLKPANILWNTVSCPSSDLTRKLVFKVCDFGSCEMIGNVAANDPPSPGGSPNTLSSPVMSPRGHAVIGTGAYMAPERSRCLPYDGRADVWSLGLAVIEIAAELTEPFGVTLAHGALSRMNLSPLPDTSSTIKVCYTAMLTDFPDVANDWPAFCRSEISAALARCPKRLADGLMPSLASSLSPSLLPPQPSHSTTDLNAFIDFAVECLTLDARRRPTVAELLTRPSVWCSVSME